MHWLSQGLRALWVKKWLDALDTIIGTLQLLNNPKRSSQALLVRWIIQEFGSVRIKTDASKYLKRKNFYIFEGNVSRICWLCGGSQKPVASFGILGACVVRRAGASPGANLCLELTRLRAAISRTIGG